jgi:hypothetical protein
MQLSRILQPNRIGMFLGRHHLEEIRCDAHRSRHGQSHPHLTRSRLAHVLYHVTGAAETMVHHACRASCNSWTLLGIAASICDLDLV